MASDRHTAGIAGVVGALGVVFGDIGTSPLYALRTILGEGDRIDETTVYGLTSLVVWSLLLVVTALYVGLLLRVDNDGEGGLLALLGLLRPRLRGRAAILVVFVAMAGSAMFLGDSVITPAISVLSAAEGLEEASPSLSVAVLPVALAILVGVFVLQRVGSGRIGRFYGPVMVVWFVVLAAAGLGSLVRDPGALTALSPHWAVRFVAGDPVTGFVALGSVVLVVTGAEALYADLGHFGRTAITRAWLVLVLPALVVAYLGEAAQVLRDPSSAADPFYAVLPSGSQIPVLVIATAATVIASEAVIAGGFTVLHQAAGLGIFPFLRTRHTSATEAGQIYLPAANWALAAAVLAVVLGFRSSDKLAAAYGLAVSLTILTTVSLFVTLVRVRDRSRWRSAAGVVLGVVVLCFFAASIPKIVSGGWLPTLMGVVLFTVMWTWWSGTRRLASARRDEEPPVRDLVGGLGRRDPDRVPGTGVFLTDDATIAPLALDSLVEIGHVLPERVIILSWHVEDTPLAPAHEARVELTDISDAYDGVLALDVRLGYQERLDVVAVLREAAEQHGELREVDPDAAYYFLSVPDPQLERHSPMARWRQRLYLLLDRLSTDRVAQLRLPRDRTVSVGRELSL